MPLLQRLLTPRKKKDKHKQSLNRQHIAHDLIDYVEPVQNNYVEDDNEMQYIDVESPDTYVPRGHLNSDHGLSDQLAYIDNERESSNNYLKAVDADGFAYVANVTPREISASDPYEMRPFSNVWSRTPSMERNQYQSNSDVTDKDMEILFNKLYCAAQLRNGGASLPPIEYKIYGIVRQLMQMTVVDSSKNGNVNARMSTYEPIENDDSKSNRDDPIYDQINDLSIEIDRETGNCEPRDTISYITLPERTYVSLPDRQ